MTVTDLQKLALDALDQLGSMTPGELKTACLIAPKSIGGFQGSLRRLFERNLVATDAYQIWITADGVHAIEKHNMAQGWPE